VEVEPDLARRAAVNLTTWPWATVTHGNGTADLPAESDLVLVHAGATHVLDPWLDALRDGGRLVVPLTGTFASTIANIGKGVMLLVTRAGQEWRARILPAIPVAIYSLKEVRDEALGGALSQAIMSGRLMQATRLRRDRHDATDTCVLHAASTCLTAD
jgi:protein-L-isoaspartate(D-aspartate) O-methyltransferase